ncbi:hypothetical protein ERJ75_000221400 [Trypanosoma vivax]|nr:hypothetical protein ERJ75_000221400 [Trypanosoma vivax]
MSGAVELSRQIEMRSGWCARTHLTAALLSAAAERGVHWLASRCIEDTKLSGPGSEWRTMVETRAKDTQESDAEMVEKNAGSCRTGALAVRDRRS